MAHPAKQMARQQQTLETVLQSLDDLHAKMDMIGQALGLVKADPAPVEDEPLMGEPLAEVAEIVAEVVEEPAPASKKRK